jgi:hypothetical protein
MALVYEKANRDVDSILLNEARLSTDPSANVAKPIKPTKPVIKSPLDTVAVKPIINNKVDFF